MDRAAKLAVELIVRSTGELPSSVIHSIRRVLSDTIYAPNAPAVALSAQ
jgi:hypothetical protein